MYRDDVTKDSELVLRLSDGNLMAFNALNEGWSNWRRTGFPVLTANSYPVKDIATDFIYRLTYPSGEANINTEKFD